MTAFALVPLGLNMTFEKCIQQIAQLHLLTFFFSSEMKYVIIGQTKSKGDLLDRRHLNLFGAHYVVDAKR